MLWQQWSNFSYTRFSRYAMTFLISVPIAICTSGFESQAFPSPSPIHIEFSQSLDVRQLYQQGLQQLNSRAYEEALSLFQELLEMELTEYNQAEVLYYLGQAYYALGRYNHALNRQELSLELWDILAIQYEGSGLESDIQNIDFNRALTITGIGRSFRRLGEYEQAEDRYNEAIVIHENLGDLHKWALVKNEIASLFQNQSRYEDALRSYEEALGILEGLGSYPSDEAIVLNNMGVTYQSIGVNNQALEFYERALSIESIDIETRLTALINAASIYVLNDDLQSAEQRYQDIIDLRSGESELSINPVREAKLAADIGSFYAAQRRYNEALEAYEQALNIYTLQKNRSGEALLLNNIADVYASYEAYELAETFYLEALQIHEGGEVNDLLGKGKSLTALGQLYDSLDDKGTARLYYQRAIDEVFESALANIQSSYLKASFADQNIHVYNRLIEILWDEGQYELAFHYVERSRSRAFLDQIANGTIQFRADADGQLLAEEQLQRAELTELQDVLDRISFVATESEQTVTLRAELVRRQQEYLNLLERLQRQSPQSADLTAVDPAPLDIIQELLDSETTLVEYFALENKLLVFIITQDKFHAEELPLDRVAINEAIQSFYSYDLSVTDPPHPDSLKKLYSALIFPIESHILTSRLKIVPHEILHYVPFAALTNGQQYLIDQYQLVYLPSANSLRFLNTPSQDSGNPIIFGNPTFDLPFSSEEARVIADLYDVQPIIGNAATESRLRFEAVQASVLHLATHGEYNSENPLFSQLLFADSADDNDGYLQVHEIYGLDLTKNTHLVVLSACQTQVAESSNGDEIIGLNRAFLYAGTPNVIATLWPVSDEATAKLMEQFYVFLQQGMTIAEALQKSQQEIRKEYSHPYYWAAFSLTGNGQ